MKRIKNFVIRCMFLLIPNKWVVSFLYRIRLHEKLHYRSPKTFTEKLNVNKFNKTYLQYSKYCDKIAVKDYVNGVMGEDICIPTLLTTKSFRPLTLIIYQIRLL